MLSKRKELRNNSTSAESVLWNLLKNKQVLGMKFRRQHSVGPYILDFYCPQIRLCIELDGHDHFTSIGDMQDDIRTDYLYRHHNIRTIRFENCDIFNHPEEVINTISQTIQTLSTGDILTEQQDTPSASLPIGSSIAQGGHCAPLTRHGLAFSQPSKGLATPPNLGGQYK